MFLQIFVLIILTTGGKTQTTMEYNIVFILEEYYTMVSEWATDIFHDIEEINKNMKITKTVIVLDRTKENEILDEFCSSINSAGVSIILDISISGFDLIFSMAKSKKIPYLRIDISTAPFVEALDKYLEQRNATDCAIIAEDEKGVDQVLFYFIDYSNLRIMVVDGLDAKSTAGLKNMNPPPSYWAIIAPTDALKNLYEYAKEHGLVYRQDRWNFVSTDFKQSLLRKTFTENMTYIYPSTSICCKILQASGCSCPDDFNVQKELFKTFLDYVMRVMLSLVAAEMDMSTKIINCSNMQSVFDESISKSFNDKIIDDLKVSDLFKFNSIKKLFIFKFQMEIVTYDMNDQLGKLATWSIEKGLQVEPNKQIIQTRLFFRVGTVEAVPWTMKMRDPDTGEVMFNSDGSVIWTGYCIDLIQALSEKLNFDYELVFPTSGEFGKKLNNGTWNGLVGDLMKGKTDLVVAALTMTADREEVIDFVAPYFEQTGILIVIRKPVRSTSLFKFMTVLKMEVWLSILGALTVTAIMIWILDKYSPYSAKNNKKLYPYPCRDFTLKESFWFALTSFTPQGGGEAPKALSGRTIVAAYWLFVVLMLATFTANLAAFLTVERMQTPVQSLEQLARQSRINYTVVADSMAHQYFLNMKNAEDTLYNMWKELTLNASSDQTKYRIWDYPIKEQYGHILLAIEETEPVPNASVGFQKVLEHADADFAFIHDSSEIRYEVSRNCNFSIVGETFAEQPYAVAVQQGSHLQEEISKIVLDLQRDRYFENLNAKYWNFSARGECANTEESEGITLRSLGGVFIATLFGLALAMITLAGEIFYYKQKEKNQVQDLKAPNKKEPPRPESPKVVTIGKTFKPINDKLPKVSHISVFPRHQFHP